MRCAIPLLICLTCGAPAVEGLTDTENDRWLADDKAMHAAGGMVVGAFGYLMADELCPRWPEWKKIAAGVAASAVVGALKEVSDARDPENHCASIKDGLATVAGGVLGSVSLSLVIRF